MKKQNKSVPEQQDEMRNESFKEQFEKDIVKSVESFQGDVLTALGILDKISNEMTNDFINKNDNLIFDNLLDGINPEDPLIDFDEFFTQPKKHK